MGKLRQRGQGHKIKQWVSFFQHICHKHFLRVGPCTLGSVGLHAHWEKEKQAGKAKGYKSREQKELYSNRLSM